jgi:hypothetical protein
VNDPADGSGAAEAASEPVEEIVVLAHGGQLYMYRPMPVELPPFDFNHDYRHTSRMLDDWNWSQRIAPAPLPMCIVTGI